MKKLLLLLALLFIPLSTSAQVGNMFLLPFAGVPSGLCAEPLGFALDTTNGDFYSCDASAWVKIGPGAAGGAPVGAKYIVAELDATLTAEIAPGADDQVPVSDSATAATWRAIPDCGAEGDTLNYTAATNTFSCLVDAGAAGGSQHQIDGVNLTINDPINFLDTSEFDWTNPASGNLSLALKSASVTDSKLAAITNRAKLPAAIAYEDEVNIFTLAGGITMDNQLGLRMRELTASGTNFAEFRAAGTMAGNITWTLPASDVAGFFRSNGVGAVSLNAAGGVGSCGANQFETGDNDNATPTCVQPNFTNLAGTATDAQIPDTITLTNLTQITTRAHSDLQGITATDHHTAALLLSGGTMTGEEVLAAAGAALSGGGLVDCDAATTAKLLWDLTTARFSCGTDQSAGAPALSAIVAAAAGNTINNGDNAQVWNFSLTTADKVAFKFGENTASVATGNPIILNAVTLAASTAHPFQATSRGPGNGIRVGATDGILIALGTGGLDWPGLLNYPTACSATFVRAILDTPICEAVVLTADVSGILPVGNGGTGAGAFTLGSVVFAGASGVYTQDNANFFWDDTNKRLGIGTVAPDAALTISGITATTSRFRVRRTSDTVFGSSLSLTKARGTSGAPLAVLSGDELGTIRGRGRGATGEINSVEIAFMATENWTDAAAGAEIVFETTPNGTIIRVIRASIKENGFFNFAGIAGAAPSVAGDFAYDSTSDTLEYGDGSNRTIIHTTSTPNAAGDISGDYSAGLTINAGVVASTELATANKTFKCNFVLFRDTGLKDSDDINSISNCSRPGRAITITVFRCETDAGSPIVNAQRDDGTPANLLTGNLTCTTAGADGTLAAAEDNFAATDALDFVAVSGMSGANRISLMVEFTVD